MSRNKQAIADTSHGYGPDRIEEGQTFKNNEVGILDLLQADITMLVSVTPTSVTAVAVGVGDSTATGGCTTAALWA